MWCCAGAVLVLLSLVWTRCADTTEAIKNFLVGFDPVTFSSTNVFDAGVDDNDNDDDDICRRSRSGQHATRCFRRRHRRFAYSKNFGAMTATKDAICWCSVVVLIIIHHQPTVPADVHMFTKGRVFVVNSGDEVKLECDFHSDQFNLFDNPILWRKWQKGEQTQMNMMGNLMEPFESARRFRVSFLQKPSMKFTLGLTISETYHEDSGNYTCEVNGPQNALLASVTHYIFVRAAVQRITIVGNNNSATTVDDDDDETVNDDAEDGQTTTREPNVIFVENFPATLMCVAVGGYPPPDITVQIGRREVTNEFQLNHSVQLAGTRSMRQIVYTTVRKQTNFYARSSDDGKRIMCVVTVAGLESNVTLARIVVNYAPQISCESKYATTGDKNVFLSCDIKSKPEVAAMFWIIDLNGTTLSEGEVINEHWTLVTSRSDGVLETRLYLRETKADSFGKYTIVAENSLGVKTQEVHLLPKMQASTKLDITPKMRLAPRDQSAEPNTVKSRTIIFNTLVSNSATSCIIPRLTLIRGWIFLLLAALGSHSLRRVS